jgi:hypothetical protein
MLSRKQNLKRYAIVFSSLVALFGVQLTRPVSSVAGAGSSQPPPVTSAAGKSEAKAASSPSANPSPTLSDKDLEQRYSDLDRQMAALKQDMEQNGPNQKFWDQYEILSRQMEEITGRIHKQDKDAPFVPQVSACISGAISAGSPTYSRVNANTLGTGLDSPCATGDQPAARYDVYQFNLTGCTTFPTQVTISLCGGSLPGAPCPTSTFDSVLYIYRSGGLTAGTGAINPFNPANPCANVQAGNDDLTTGTTTTGGSSCDGATCHPVCTGATSRSGLIRTLGAGFFQVVVATFGSTNTGAYSLFVNAPGAGCNLNAPTAINLELVSATSYAGGVSIDWKTGQEVNNLGFNVYRDQGGKRTLVTEQMVAGSALFAGPGTTLGAGQSYSWFDSLARTKDAQYWLEEIDLNGASTWHGPVAVTDSGNKFISPPRRGRNALISTLGATGGQSSSGPVEARASLPEATQDRLQAQSRIASQKGAKLSVRQEGIYRVSQPDLVGAGLDANIDPRSLQLYVDGQQIPIAEVNTSGGRFDSSSAIEFYGQGIDSAVTDSRTYWLVAGSEPGLRMAQAAGKVKSGKSSAASFPYTVERKDRTIYFSALRNGEKENFFGAVVARNPVEQALSLQHIDATASEAFVEVALQGVSQVPHRVQVQLNGARAGEVSFNGQASGTGRFSIPHALLKEGQNTVTLLSLGEPSDISLVDYVRITYQHRFAADDDALKFTARGKQAVTIDGFSNADIRVFDITNPNNVQEVFGKVKQRGAGYSISLRSPGNSQSTLLALAGGQAKSPSSIAASRGTNLRQEGAGADLLIITRRDFFDSLSPLVALRQSQGLTVSVIGIDDIYDSFGFGQKSPQAMRDFLAFAKAGYKTAPRYVLIVGDASLDPKDYLGLGDNDIVPTKLIDTQLMETASDDWFVEPSGMAIGRLPASTAGDAAIFAAKLVSYDQAAPSQEVLLVADSDETYNFEGISTQLRGLIPSSLRVERIDRGKDGDSMAKTRLINALFRGQKVVNYVGHGSVDQWKSNLLTGTDIGDLRGSGSLPVFVMMTCLNGYFQDVSLDSLAETLVKAPKGAIAVWASSGMTSPDVQAPANHELYRWLFDKNSPSIMLGDAIGRAKAASGNDDVRRTWILFGDPTMRLR